MTSLQSRAQADIGALDLGQLHDNGFGLPDSEYEKAHTYPISVPTWFPSTRAEVHRAFAESYDPHATYDVYIHVPFCAYKCSFCLYYKETGTSRSVQQAFVETLVQELGRMREVVGRRVACRQVYIGGGTPSFLKGPHLSELLDGISQHFEVAAGASICCEASPETLTADKLDRLRAWGVNRISMGIQATQDHLLEAIKRGHTTQTAIRAVDAIRAAGFSEFNLDLIYGFPEQSLQDWEETLDLVLDLEPSGLTAYHLRSVPGTEQHRTDGRGDTSWEKLLVMRQMAHLAAVDRGFRRIRPHQYVVPKRVTSGYHCAPALDTRRSGGQLGFGPSAYGHIADTVFLNGATLADYVAHTHDDFGAVREYAMNEADKRCRTVIRALIDDFRLDRAEFESRHGCAVEDVYGPLIETLIAHGLVEDTPDALRLTDTGVLLNEQVSRAFFPQSMQRRLEAITKAETPYHDVMDSDQMAVDR
jgi:oxygen-independent coproporphyrinogen-3 oxidase